MSNAKRPEDVDRERAVHRRARAAYEQSADTRSCAIASPKICRWRRSSFARGGESSMLIASDQFSTHMYASLREIVGGWRKNIYAGGRHAALGGASDGALYPCIIARRCRSSDLVPPVALVLGTRRRAVERLARLVGDRRGGRARYSGWRFTFYECAGEIRVLYPLGLAMLLYIAVGAVVRGRRVEWKERKYDSA